MEREASSELGSVGEELLLLLSPTSVGSRPNGFSIRNTLRTGSEFALEVGGDVTVIETVNSAGLLKFVLENEYVGHSSVGRINKRLGCGLDACLETHRGTSKVEPVVKLDEAVCSQSHGLRGQRDLLGRNEPTVL